MASPARIRASSGPSHGRSSSTSLGPAPTRALPALGARRRHAISSAPERGDRRSQEEQVPERPGADQEHFQRAPSGHVDTHGRRVAEDVRGAQHHDVRARSARGAQRDVVAAPRASRPGRRPGALPPSGRRRPTARAGATGCRRALSPGSVAARARPRSLEACCRPRRSRCPWMPRAPGSEGFRLRPWRPRAARSGRSAPSRYPRRARAPSAHAGAASSVRRRRPGTERRRAGDRRSDRRPATTASAFPAGTSSC